MQDSLQLMEQNKDREYGTSQSPTPKQGFFNRNQRKNRNISQNMTKLVNTSLF
jgi:hypothetical protein